MFASDSPTPPAAASTQVGGDPSQPGRLWRLPLPLPDPPTPAPSLYLPRQPRGGSQSERRRRHVTAQSWCQGARGERGAEPRGAAAGAQCERHPSQPHPRVRAVAVPIPDAVRPEALDLPARGVPGAGEPGLGFLAAALGTALGRARHQNTLEGVAERMLMFDPVPVKQEAMDPVSVVTTDVRHILHRACQTGARPL